MGDQKWSPSLWEIVAITPNIPADAFSEAVSLIIKKLIWAKMIHWALSSRAA